MIEFIGVDCPYCGERFETRIDTSAGDQTYVEDCAVCCRPIVVALHLGAEGELLDLSVRREQD